MDFPMLNKCPKYNLYISGFIALRRPKALRNCNITHIVSVLDWQFEQDNPLTRGFQHLHIPVDDVEDENLLVWFPRSNDFLQEGLNYSRTSRNAGSRSEVEGADPELGSGVLIHCAMGKSRSSTVIIAYLLWSSRQPPPRSQTSSNDPDMISLQPKPFSVIEALTLLRQGRPIAEPNEGFMDQLYLYVDMGCPSTQSELESHKLYRRWMNKRNVAESLRINQAPDTVDIKFEDEDDEASTPSPTEDTTSAEQNLANLALSKPSPPDQETIAPGIAAPTGTEPPSQHPKANSLAATAINSPQTDLLLKCRRCRHLLARSNFILPHSPLHSDPSFTSQHPPSTQLPNDGSSPHASDLSLSTNTNIPHPAPQCAHIFLHPLSWMKSALSSGALDGKLLCPNKKCNQNIGKFAWQGLRCSCGGWVTPGFGVARGKVDEIKIDLDLGDGKAAAAKHSGHGQGMGGNDAGGGAMRLPPGMRRGGGNL